MRGYKNFEGTPHPGDLCHMVEIGYTENAINANGYPEPKDVVLCRVWASAVDAGNQHYRAADVMNTEQVINFTIRYRRDVKPGMWVKFQDEKWIISTLGEYSFKKTYLGLKASIAKGVSQLSNAPQQRRTADLKLLRGKQRHDHGFAILDGAGFEQQHFLFFVDQQLHLTGLLQLIQHIFVQKNALFLGAEGHDQRFFLSERNDVVHTFVTSPVS